MAAALVAGPSHDAKFAKLSAKSRVFLTKEGFSCNGRGAGYYADVTTGCQVYHMCDGLGRQFSYKCPNATLFQQRMLICDHWYMVNCSKSVQDYGANLLIGQNKPFVEDSDSNPYARTPRPDLLSAPLDASEHDIIYRSGENSNLSPKNLVGSESIDEDSTESTYFPTNNWSTQVPKQTKTSSPVRPNPYKEYTQTSNVYRTNYNSGRSRNNDSFTGPKAKAIQVDSANRNSNTFSSTKERSRPQGTSSTVYKSNFKATTPVYPSSVEEKASLKNIDLLPPLPYANSRNDISKNQALNLDLLPPNQFGNEKDDSGQLDILLQGGEHFSFPSNFKATTPVYPSREELIRDFATKKSGVNFQSNFKATTPVYPNTVDPTSPDPSKVGVLPPKGSSASFESHFEATTPQYPTSVDPTSPDPNQAGLLPPRSTDIRSSFESRYKATTPQYPTSVDPTSPNPSDVGLLPPKKNNFINYHSNFKATTPQYPNYVEPTSQNPNDVGLLPPKESNFVNFESNFKATTPQYPDHVNPTSPDPNQVGVLPPKHAVPDFESYQKSEEEKGSFSSFPSKFYQPPKFDQDAILDESELQEQPGIRMLNFMKSFNQSQWQDLRKVFHIPEYDFPLDDATRPSYDSVVNSFEPRPVKKR
nr:DNA-directed RNA polymerase II subunit RPB1 [Leptinotarsa decemlineata]